jgi:hypothetical protein
VQCTGAFKSDLGNVMCSHDKFLIWISWVLYLNLFLISVWYVRTGSNLCSMMTWIFYPKLYLYIVDTCLYLLMTIVYIYIWWQFPHLYGLWNMNKWMNVTVEKHIENSRFFKAYMNRLLVYGENTIITNMCMSTYLTSCHWLDS